MMALGRVETRIRDLNDAITSLKAFLALHAPRGVVDMGTITPIDSEEDTQRSITKHYTYHSMDPQFGFVLDTQGSKGRYGDINKDTSKPSSKQDWSESIGTDSNEITAPATTSSQKLKYPNGIFPTPDLSPLSRNVIRSNNDVTDAEPLPPPARPVSGCLTPVSTAETVNIMAENIGDAVKERLEDDDCEYQLRRVENGKLFFSRSQERRSGSKRSDDGKIRRWRSKSARQEDESRMRVSRSEEISCRSKDAIEADDYDEACKSEGSVGKRKLAPLNGSLPPAKRRISSSANDNGQSLADSSNLPDSSSSHDGSSVEISYHTTYQIPSSPQRKRKFDEELDEHIEKSKRLLSSENRIPLGRKSNADNSSSPRAKRRILRRYAKGDDSDCEDLQALSRGGDFDDASSLESSSNSDGGSSYSSSGLPNPPKRTRAPPKRKAAVPKPSKPNPANEKAALRKQWKANWKAAVKAALDDLKTANYANFPVGMVNTTRNSCFINVVMQILYRIKECRDYLLERSQAAPPRPEGVKIRRKVAGRASRSEQKPAESQPPAGKLIDALCRDMRFMHNDEHSTSFNPVDFVSAVSEHFQDRNCDPCVQSDAMEFLELLFRHIQGEVAVEHSESGSEMSAAESDFVAAFQGDKIHKYRCLTCSSKWESNETFEQLLVPIHDNNEGLSDRLKGHFVDGLELGGPGRPCECRGEMWRKTRLAKLPATLRVVLQRTLDGMGKTSQHVQFPATLELGSEICDEKIGKGEYDLFGVVVHAGKVAVGGHYTCYVKQDDYWFYLDDGESRLVAVEEVLAAEATALFYHQHTETERSSSSTAPIQSPVISPMSVAHTVAAVAESSAPSASINALPESINRDASKSEPSAITGHSVVPESSSAPDLPAPQNIAASVAQSSFFSHPCSHADS